MLKQYFLLTKPGILFGNLVTTLGGLFLAAPSIVSTVVFLTTLLGTTLVVASGCVFNNIIDQDIDQNMHRTQTRALVQKIISPTKAFVYASVLGVLGFLLLYIVVNPLACLFAVVGFLVYVILYSLWAKRVTIHQTILGSISGACPPVIGYCAMHPHIDAGAVLIFLGYALWQMPHSWGIAIYRYDDYQRAQIPILPVACSIKRTKVECFIYVILFTFTMNGLYVLNYTNIYYLILLNSGCLYWIYLSYQGFNTLDDQVWAKQYFLFSVKLITLLSLTFLLTRTAEWPRFTF